MKNITIKIFSLHFIILATYIGITDYFFIIQKDPSPIGTGFQQLFFNFLHGFITAFVCLLIAYYAKNKAMVKQIFITNMAAVLFWIIVHLIITIWLDEYLWQLRKS